MHMCSIFILAQGRKAQMCGLFYFSECIILTLVFFCASSTFETRSRQYLWSAIHGSIGHPSGPTKIILIYTPNEFLILTAYLLRELGRILQGVVDCNEWWTTVSSHVAYTAWLLHVIDECYRVAVTMGLLPWDWVKASIILCRKVWVLSVRISTTHCKEEVVSWGVLRTQDLIFSHIWLPSAFRVHFDSRSHSEQRYAWMTWCRNFYREGRRWDGSPTSMDILL